MTECREVCSKVAAEQNADPARASVTLSWVKKLSPKMLLMNSVKKGFKFSKERSETLESSLPVCSPLLSGKKAEKAAWCNHTQICSPCNCSNSVSEKSGYSVLL